MRRNVTPSRPTNGPNPPQPSPGPQTLAALLAGPRASSPLRDSHASVRAEDGSPEQGSPEQECITADKLASWMGLNRKTVYEYAARGVIPCRRLGRRLVFSLPAIRAWLARSSGSDPSPLLAVRSRRR